LGCVVNDEVVAMGITLEYHRSNDCGSYAKILLLILIERKICETRNNQPSNHRGEESYYNTYYDSTFIINNTMRQTSSQINNTINILDWMFWSSSPCAKLLPLLGGSVLLPRRVTFHPLASIHPLPNMHPRPQIHPLH